MSCDFPIGICLGGLLVMAILIWGISSCEDRSELGRCAVSFSFETWGAHYEPV